MLRKLMAVIVGYVVMGGIVMVADTAAAAMLGMDGVYKPALYEPTMSWIVLGFASGLLAAVAGGYVCRSIGRSRQLLHAFAGVVLLLGLISAGVASMGPKDVAPREANETIAEAARKTRQPLWVGLLNPLISAAGVLLGGSLRRDPPT